jgi:hypothetical protein
MNEAELRVAAYLDSHRYMWSHEPDYQAEFCLQAPLATKPDFLVARGDTRAVAEVRQFETTHIRDRLAKAAGYGSLSPQEVYGSLRSAMVGKGAAAASVRRSARPLACAARQPARR